MAESVTCSGLENHQVLVQTPAHSWVGDLPAAKGGDGVGGSPFDHLVGALGACITTVVRMYAARRKIALEQIRAELHGHWDKPGGVERYYIDIVLHVGGELSDDDVKRLGAAAGSCPIHKFLHEAVTLTVQAQRV